MDEATAIHLIADDPTAQKMIAAWPHLKRDEAGEPDIDQWIELAITHYNQLLKERYYRTAKMLLETGICKKDGSINEFVKKYLNALVLKAAGVPVRKRGG